MKRLAAAFLAVGLLAVSGCGGITRGLFGTQGEYLLFAYDVVVLPNQPAPLRARLQAGTFLSDKVDVEIVYYYQGQRYATAYTDSDGFAEVQFTPPKTGDYVFEVVYQPAESGDEKKPEAIKAEFVVASRQADTPFVVVDLDKTLVESGFQTVLAGDPTPMPGSVDVMYRLTKDYSVIYLTHRPDYLGPKSEAWLRRKGYPRAPLLVSDLKGLVEGSGTFKGHTLQALREKFGNLRVGIGDKISDVQAYTENGMRGFLLIHPQDDWDADDYRELVDDLGVLDESVQVVTHWRQISDVLYGSADHSLPTVRRQLLARARAITEAENAGKDEDD